MVVRVTLDEWSLCGTTWNVVDAIPDHYCADWSDVHTVCHGKSSGRVTTQVAQERSNHPQVCDHALGVAGQCLEHIPLLIPDRREDGPDYGKVLRIGLGAESPGDLLSQP